MYVNGTHQAVELRWDPNRSRQRQAAREIPIHDILTAMIPAMVPFVCCWSNLANSAWGDLCAVISCKDTERVGLRPTELQMI